MQSTSHYLRWIGGVGAKTYSVNYTVWQVFPHLGSARRLLPSRVVWLNCHRSKLKRVFETQFSQQIFISVFWNTWEFPGHKGISLQSSISEVWCWRRLLRVPLNCKEIKPVNPIGNRSWIFIGRTHAEASILWPPDGKNWLIRKDPDAVKDWG